MPRKRSLAAAPARRTFDLLRGSLLLGSLLMILLTAAPAWANTPPVAVADHAITRADESVDIEVTANDTDADGDTLVLVPDPILIVPTSGTASRLSGTTVRYTPDAGFAGTDTFRYRIRDGNGGLDSAGVTVTVTANTPPQAAADQAVTRAGASVDIEVTANDTDADGDTLVLVPDPILVVPASGTATRLSGTAVRYTPDPGFAGTDSFRYRIRDGHGGLDSAVVSVTVTPNQAPQAVDDARSVDSGAVVEIAVTANDSDPDGDTVRLATGSAILEPPTLGTAVRVDDDTVRYTPGSAFSGDDSFRYRITDGTDFDSAIVRLRFGNQAPDAQPDAAETHVGTPIELDVVANDSDPEGDSVVLVASPILIAPTYGTATKISATRIRYTPAGGFIGQDSFRYRVTDGYGAVDSALVTVAVTNAAPVAVNDTATTARETSLTIDVADNDSDPDGDAFVVSNILQPPPNGTATRINARDVVYTPDSGFDGEDSFVYELRDDHGATAQATVTVTVTPADAPTVTSTSRDTIRRGTITQLVIDGTDLEDASVEIATAPFDGNAPPRVFPSAELVSANAAGTRIWVRIDARDAAIDGYYNLAITTPGGLAAAQFRVVGPEPVIDAFTPSQPVAGKVHVLSLIGVNLQGAQVVPNHPAISVLGLENGDDKILHGLIYVGDGAPPGILDIDVEGPGGTTSLPIDIVRTPEEPAYRTSKVAAPNQQAGGEDLELYFQQPKVLLGGGPPPERAAGGPAAKMGGFCIGFGSRVEFSLTAVLISLFDDLGDPVTRQVLDALLPGSRLSFSALTVALHAWLEITFDFTWCEGTPSDLDVCAQGGIAFLVPGIGGWESSFSSCFFGGNFENPIGAVGGINRFDYGSNSDCFTVSDLDPVSNLGDRPGEVEMSCCGNADLTLDVEGRFFDERPFQAQFDVVEIRPQCLAAESFDVRITAFIPGDHVDISPCDPLGSCVMPGGTRSPKLVEADDRGCSPTSNAYRAAGFFSVAPGQQANPSDFVASSFGLGSTDVFAMDALSGDNDINAGDRDDRLGDCSLWHEHHSSVGPGGAPAVTRRIDASTLELTSVMSTGTGAAPFGLVPRIDWDLTLRINEEGSWVLQGWHDCYPAYEVYIDGEKIYSFAPPTTACWRILACLPGAGDVFVSCTGTVGLVAPDCGP